MHTPQRFYFVQRHTSVTTRRTIKLAHDLMRRQLESEPRGWFRLANMLHNRHGIGRTSTGQVGEKDRLTAYKFAHLTRPGVTLSPDQFKELQLFLAHGGTLIVDAAGGSGQTVAASCDPRSTSSFPQHRLDLVPLDAQFSPSHPTQPSLRIPSCGFPSTHRPTRVCHPARRPAASCTGEDQPASPEHDPLIQVGYRRFAKSRIGSGGLRLLGSKIGKAISRLIQSRGPLRRTGRPGHRRGGWLSPRCRYRDRPPHHHQRLGQVKLSPAHRPRSGSAASQLAPHNSP